MIEMTDPFRQELLSTLHLLQEVLTPALWLAWGATIMLTAWIVRLITRRAQSASMVEELKKELHDERRRHARLENIHEHKLAVYRTAAVGQRVKELFAEAERPRLIVRR